MPVGICSVQDDRLIYRSSQFFSFFIYIRKEHWRFFFTRRNQILQSSFLRSCTTYCLCNLFIDRFFLTKAFLSESGCKDKNFISYLPNFFEVFFSFFSGALCEALLDKDHLSGLLFLQNVSRKRSKTANRSFRVFQNVISSLLSFSKAGAKVVGF